MSPYGKKKKGKTNSLVMIGVAAAAAYLVFNKTTAPEPPAQKITGLRLFYYSKTTNEVVEANVFNGATYNGTAMGLHVKFTDASENGSAVRITYDSSKDGVSVTGNSRSFVLSPGETRSYHLEPNEYGGTSMGADTVAFVVEVLPPQTGGVPREGETYPTYRFEYRL